MKEEDLSMEDPVSHSSSPNTVHNKMLVNVHHSSDAASTNKSADFADNQHGHDHCWELLLRYDDAQVGFAPGRFPQRKGEDVWEGGWSGCGKGCQRLQYPVPQPR